MSVVVTQAGPDVVDELAPLFDAYRAFYGRESDVDSVRAYLRERLERDEATVFLAKLDDAAAGFVLLYPTFSSISMRRRWTLNDLFVRESCRRRGVAEALMARAERLAAETDADKLELLTDATNTPAQTLYERRGWVRDTAFWRYTRGV